MRSLGAAQQGFAADRFQRPLLPSLPLPAAAETWRWAHRTDHEVTDAAPADEMAVNAEGASRDLRVSPALENSRIWPDGRTVGERAPRRRIVAA
jgi:hypothetical protein